MEYYYLGNIEKAAYYNNRMMKSTYEPIKSELRQYRHIFKYDINY